jgi:glucokinase
MSPLAIGIDIGGTKVAAGVVDDDGKILAETRRPTPSNDPVKLAALVAEAVTELRAGHDVAAVGVGAAGWVDAARTTVLFAPNLAGWRNAPLQADLSRLVDLPVDIENDANAAAWGEHRFGAGEQEPDTVVLTVGTGVGGGLIIDGALRRGRFGIAGEPGHYRVVPGGRLCGCGNHGCFEQYCSGTALVRAAREIARERPADATRLLELAGGDPEAIDGPTVTAAAQEGDHAAVDCFEEVGRWLGQGLADLTALLDPGRFVIGGGVAAAGELLLRPGRDTYAAVISGRGYRTLADVVPARLGADAGLIGAADLARQLLS